MQFSKGPYFADQGDFATAGAANINYANVLDRPIVRVGGGGEGFGRALAAASPRGRRRPAAGGARGRSTTTARGSRPTTTARSTASCATASGDAVNGLSVTGMGYRGTWNSTDQVPQRAIDDGLIGRFGALDPTDGGDTYRYSGSVEWQRHARQRHDQGGRLRHRLRPESVLELHLLPRRSGARRSVPSGRSPLRQRRQGQPPAARPLVRTRRCRTPSACSCATTTSPTSACITPRRAQPLDTVRQDAVLQTSVGGYAQNETAWTPWLRTLAGVRVDGYRFDVDAERSGEQRHRRAPGIVSPKGGVVLGPLRGHRALRQRRPRLPQQRRARRDDHARSGDRRAGRSA